MNWLGKVFVVVILIMSLVFMGLAMAVYATHKNWKTVSENFEQASSRNRKAERQALEPTHNRRVEDLEREKTTAKQQAAKLEAERVSLAERNAQIQTELDGLKQNQREHIAAVASTQKINQALAGEVAELRQKIRNEQQTAIACSRQLSTRPKNCTKPPANTRVPANEASSSPSRLPA